MGVQDPVQRELELRNALDEARGLDIEDPRRTAAVVELAHFLSNRGRSDEAIALYQSHLTELQQILGTMRPAWAEIANALAVEWIHAGQHSKAEKLLAKSFQAREATLGRESPEVLECLHNQAALHQVKGQLQEAERLYKEALEGRERLLGGDHWATATTRSNLGKLYLVRGEFTLAEKLLRTAVASFGEGKDSPAEAVSAVMNLADLHVRLNKWEESASLYAKALEIARVHLPEQNPLVGEVLSVLAAAEHSRGGDLNRAEQLYRQAIEIQGKVLGGRSESFADTLEGLGAVLYEMGRPGRGGEVREILERSVEVRTSVIGLQDPELAPALSRLAWLYGAAGEEHRAEETWKRVLGLLRPIADVDRDKWIDALEGYAAWLEQEGRDEEALDIREEAMRASEIPSLTA